MESMIIIGTGGFAKELAGLLISVGTSLEGFIGPKPTRELPEKWLGDDEFLENLSPNTKFLIAIGSPKTRSQLADKLNLHKFQQQTFIHPNSHISPDVSISKGSIIYPNVTLHEGVFLEQNVLINSNVTIGHETTVGEFSNIGPGASIGGCCKIGKNAYIGIGVSMVENITIRSRVTIGAGSVVISDINSEGTYIGVPAKRYVKR
jgi:sugar O-acyltransferase (sialic acid O-acetyltransferase NeuD family)